MICRSCRSIVCRSVYSTLRFLWQADDEEGTADMAPEPEHSKDGAMDLFEAFAGSYFNKGADPKSVQLDLGGV